MNDTHGANTIAEDAPVPTTSSNRVVGLEDRPTRRVPGRQCAAWLVALGFIGTYLYLAIHLFWVGWPWEHHTVLYEAFAPNVRTTAEDWKFAALLVLSLGIVGVAAGARLLWKRRHPDTPLPKKRSGRARLAPPTIILYGCLYFWYASSIQPQPLRFTSQGLWYLWGFVPWSRITQYQWGHSQPYHDDGWTHVYPVLSLTLKPHVLTPSSISWTLWDYDRVAVNKLLVRYVPSSEQRTSPLRHTD